MANEVYGASGTLRARFIKSERVKGAAGKKDYAKVEIEVDGHKLKVMARGDAVLDALDGFAKGESFPFWGKLNSYTNAEKKTYTNLQIGKVYTDERETSGDVFVTGEIKEIGNIMSTKEPTKVVGKFVDVDCTQNAQYPDVVRLQLAFGTDIDLPVGQVIKVVAFLDKYAIWVFEGNVQKATKSNLPEGAVFMGRSGKKDTAAPAGDKGASKEEEAAAPAKGGEDDIPW